MPDVFVKDPGSTLDYTVDWTDWLESGETIDSVTWDVPAGLTQATAPTGWSEPDPDHKRTVWLSGGTAGTDYSVGCQITTTAASITGAYRVDERSVTVRVRQR